MSDARKVAIPARVEDWERANDVVLCVNGVHSSVCNECSTVDIREYMAGRQGQLAVMVQWFSTRQPTGTVTEATPSSLDLRRVTDVTVPNLVVIIAAIEAGHRVIPAGTACIIAIRSMFKRGTRKRQ